MMGTFILSKAATSILTTKMWKKVDVGNKLPTYNVLHFVAGISNNN